jgi:alkylation response protein AidB-like acyl-CoA dehydrogenase
MHPAPTTDQQELKSAVRELCAREVTMERLLAWEQDALGYGTGLARAVAELGWLGFGVPTSAGGSGASLVETACIVEEASRGLLPRPLIGAIRSTAALADLDPSHPLLPSLVQGKGTLALALDEESARAPRAYRTAVSSARATAVVSGRKAYVLDANADHHLVAGLESGGVSLVIVERQAPAVVVEPLRSFGGDRQSHVRYAEAPIMHRLSAPGAGEAALQRVWRRQVALGLAEMVGGMDAVVDMTVAYVKEREQFGQKIALFQAVRHQIADMATTFTAARHLAWQAISRLAAGTTEDGSELASAAAYVGQAFKHLCWAGHHLHGGAGFVVEHKMRFYSERAQALCIRYTPEGPALGEVASALLD